MSNKYIETSTGINVIRSFFGENGMDSKSKQSQQSALSVRTPKKKNIYFGEFSPKSVFICSQQPTSNLSLKIDGNDSSFNDGKIFGSEEEELFEREMEEDFSKYGK